MAAPLALGPGGTTESRSAQPMAALLAGVGMTMLFGALIAAYLTLRSRIGEWPPDGLDFDNYLGATLTVTLLLSIPTVEWAVHAIRYGYRGQCLAALGLALVFGLTFTVGLWYLAGIRIEYGAGDHAYGVVTVAMLTAAGVNVAIAIGYLLLSLFRAAGGQLTASNPYLLRATAWYWHFAAAAWTAVWFAIFVTK